jgi:hypothetical protein
VAQLLNTIGVHNNQTKLWQVTMMVRFGDLILTLSMFSLLVMITKFWFGIQINVNVLKKLLLIPSVEKLNKIKLVL